MSNINLTPKKVGVIYKYLHIILKRPFCIEGFVYFNVEF